MSDFLGHIPRYYPVNYLTRTTVCIVLGLMCPFEAHGDYLFRTFHGVVRYSDTGERLIEYGGDTTSPTAGDGGYSLGESADSVALSKQGVLFATGSNLGSHSLYAFDATTGDAIQRTSDLQPHDHNNFERVLPLWTSDYLEPEFECGSQGCSQYQVFTANYTTTARLQGELIVHPDGYLYGVGVADVWNGDPAWESYLATYRALVRYPLDYQGAPSVVSLLPHTVRNDLEGYVDVSAPYLLPDGRIALTVDETIFEDLVFTREIASYAVPVSLFGAAPLGNRTITASRIDALPPGLRSRINLDTAEDFAGGWLGRPFEDDHGHILIPHTEPLSPTSTEAPVTSLLEFDAETGDFLRVVFEDRLPPELAAPEIHFFEGIYLRVPEPSTTVTLVATLVCSAAARRGANHATR